MENLLLLIVIIALFIFFSKKFTENFTLFHGDNNKNIFAKYYIDHKFNFDNKYVIDSHPSNDLNFVNSNNNSYEYNDSIFKDKLYKILEINNNLKILFKITENIKWSIWKNPDKCNEIIYKKFIKFINIILNENSLNNIYHTLNKYKVNINHSNNLLFNIDLLLYRNDKIHGKHVNLIVYYNNDKFYIIYLNIIGCVNQYNIINKTFLKDINYDNAVSYYNKNNKLNNLNNSCDNNIDITDKYVDNKISEILMKKINTPYYNKNDTKLILKNIKYNKDQNYIKNFFMKNISQNNTITPHNF
tara:strand:- start:231 stop:1133 length:903 start_codon:yes stop_codon:yes gene_type:complete